MEEGGAGARMAEDEDRHGVQGLALDASVVQCIFE